MRVTVSVHGHLKSSSSVGHDEMTFTLPDAGGMRIRDLLDGLNILEEEIGEVSANGRRVRMDKTIQGRVRLEFFPKRGS
jgi:hypothetical protein